MPPAKIGISSLSMRLSIFCAKRHGGRKVPPFRVLRRSASHGRAGSWILVVNSNSDAQRVLTAKPISKGVFLVQLLLQKKVWWTGRDLNPPSSLSIFSNILFHVALPLSFLLSVCVFALAKICEVLRRVYILWSFSVYSTTITYVLGHYYTYCSVCCTH